MNMLLPAGCIIITCKVTLKNVFRLILWDVATWFHMLSLSAIKPGNIHRCLSNQDKAHLTP